MSDIAIRVENLSKQYRIGGAQASYKTLRESLIEAVHAPFRRAGKLLRGQARSAAEMDETIWALKDISFEVKHGEVLGIIGRNGAGKTTLLKILSRITEPTEGQAEIHGRVGSLLEVGTGFHPELTGRENIYLNGAILGMKKVEIERKFDEIVDFAEIKRFLDTPVKHYSSGMYVRLAFAVAAHLESEILLVDEVLAVGDVAFQKKCLGKMGDVAKGGRTVLFISHNVSAITQLCNGCIWLDRGKMIKRGESGKVVLEYLASSQSKSINGLITADMHAHNPLEICFTRILMFDQEGVPSQSILFGQPLRIQIEFDVREPVRAARLGVVIHKLDGTLVCALHHTDDLSQDLLALQSGKYVSDMLVNVPLMPGSYTVDLFAKPDPGFWGSRERSLDWVHGAMVFDVENVPQDGPPVLLTEGVILPASRWSVSPANHRSP